MRVAIPPALRSYTGEQSAVDGSGATLAELLADLDAHFPGMRFRMVDEQDGIRRHIKIFLNRDQVKSLECELNPGDEVLIVCALSGG
jgi:molybdopterin synthase sulfur carrier subunit